MVDVEIETLLKVQMGLELDSIGKSTLNRAIKRRMNALGVFETRAYIKKLKSSRRELNELIEEVVIPETYFFRDKQPFNALAEHVASTLAPKKKSFLRLLSAPCATGEEAYSIVITLLESGIPAYQFRTYAMDISSRSLERAKKALYRKNSFRGQDLYYREKYFQRLDNTYVLEKSIRDKVRFFRGNILDPVFMESLGVFDILFCRNVLIYLDASARQRAIANLERQLAPDGLLVVGHSESGLMDRRRFAPAPYPKSFAFLKKNSKREQFPQNPASLASTKAISVHSRLLTATYKHSTTTTHSPVNSKSFKNDLKDVRRLADEGFLNRASEICNDSLRKHGPSAEAYFLLGMIRNEAGEPEEAAKLLRKAVYLKPDHIDALFLLMLLAEQSGEYNRAEIFKDRIERLQARPK